MALKAKYRPELGLLSKLSMSNTIVLYPGPSMGHVASMVNLAKLILRHHFSVTIILPSGHVDISYIHRISQTTPLITFHYLPPLSFPPNCTPTPLELISLNDHNLLHAIQTISQTSTVRCLISALSTAVHVASQLNIPFYSYFTSCAATLAVLLYFPTLHNNSTQSFKDQTSTFLQLPGLPLIRASYMPEPLLDRETQAYQYFLDYTNNLPKSKGILVNSIISLEPKPIKAISDGLCVLDGPVPSVHYIGPLINTDDRTVDGQDDGSECLSWLSGQPSRSVVFLSFGSKGRFSAEQVMEIATGLENCGYRFLWVVRSPPNGSNNSDPDLDVLLPNGFLDRTTDRGLVVKSWAPQVAILSSESVGGFVTHCGWNSVMESICAGVPMVAWPLYAEQHLTRVVLVEEMKLAISMEESEDGFVSAAELEKRVSELMDSEKGRELRERSLKTRESALAAWTQNGSSKMEFTELIEPWKRG